MNNTRYCLVFKGEITDGADIGEVKEKVKKAFNIDQTKIEQLFSGKRVVVKKNASHEECEAMGQVFEQAGAIFYIEQETETVVEVQGPPPLPGPEERKHRTAEEMPIKHADEMFCSNCGALIKIRSLSCPRCGKKQRKDGMGCLPTAAIAIGIGFFGIAIIGILAAIAIPQFVAYRTRSYEASVKSELSEVCEAEGNYYSQNSRYTDSLEALGYVARPNIAIHIVEIEDDCFYAKGEMKGLKKRFFVDCSCEISEEQIVNE